MAVSYVLAITQRWDAARLALNAIFADVKAKQGGFGASLPGTVAPDGTYFTVNSTPKKLYQAQGGAWVQVV